MSKSHQCNVNFPVTKLVWGIGHSNMNTICCNNCKISINYNNGISYQSHYLSVSVSFPRNVRALALKCQNIPQKLQVRNCFSQNKKRFWKKIAVSLSRTVYTIIVAHFYYLHILATVRTLKFGFVHQ